jgi:hypothetical protein
MYFTVGSGMNDVRHLQGKPEEIIPGPRMGGETWRYGPSSIVFSVRAAVVEWDDYAGRFRKIMLDSGHGTEAESFTVGSHMDDVIRLQGTPDRIVNNLFLHQQLWYYGASVVKVNSSTGLVQSWNNAEGNLKSANPKPNKSSGDN